MPQAELELEQGGCGQLFPGPAFQGEPVWGEYMNTGSHVPPTPSLSLDCSPQVTAQGKWQNFDVKLLSSGPSTPPGRDAEPFPCSQRGCPSLTTAGEFITARL